MQNNRDIAMYWCEARIAAHTITMYLFLVLCSGMHDLSNVNSVGALLFSIRYNRSHENSFKACKSLFKKSDLYKTLNSDCNISPTCLSIDSFKVAMV